MTTEGGVPGQYGRRSRSGDRLSPRVGGPGFFYGRR